ncbi:farnesyl pyrophosphate synthase-like [Tropilaelaps mercedesae]|uniref:Farnesyl pyrophosphate synthase n=1 Tax=Tropilaelaps mercedesae TaxID=418985 RepID=A0A1V9XWK2_9ACAR|nr:farnesyl pyrophosphate synthase-like [Tropilaelaps mercedesae]
MEQPTLLEFFRQANGDQRLQVTSGSHPIIDTAFGKLLDSLMAIDDPRLKDFVDWLRQVIEYNVPEGKRNRLVAVMLAYQSLEKGSMTEEKLEKAALLGWCVELLQAYFLICDDIMDNSLTRRGKTCWYLIEGVQMIAINDAILCETAIYRTLKAFFRNHPNYLDLLELFHEVSFQTSSGQCLDMLSERYGGHYVEERYNAIVLYKTAFYSFSLPIRLGMYLAGIADQSSHKKAEALALRIGHIFQVQDDFLDCYGVPEIIGKVGTDIVDAKCSWLIVKALQIATPDQKKILLENYGKGKPGGPEEAAVKKLYDDLDMAEVFREAEEQAFAGIRDEVTELQTTADSTVLNTDIFKLLASKIYRRDK